MTKASALTLALVSGIAALAGTTANAAEATFCENYAQQAVHEAALAQRLACAFHGPRWGTDIDTHRAWCRGATKQTVQAEAAARATDIRLCMCQWYADEAAEQAAMNAARACQFTGPRWTLDRSAHYRWCVLAKAPLATLESEVKTRERLLAECANR
jgi:hypothetical protein